MMALRGRPSADEFPENHEINVTPFIDVMLVLLIIFMVAAPLATVDVPLDLPVSNAEAPPPDSEPIVLSIQADTTWSLGERRIERAELAHALALRSHDDRSQRIFVRADKTVSYQELMDAMNALRDQGYLKVSLVGMEGSPAP